MAVTQEMFRFVAARRVQRALMHRIAARLIRDGRPAGASSLLVKLYGPGPFDSKLVQANGFAAGAGFVDADDALMRLLEPAVAFFRERLAAGAAIGELASAFESERPLLAALLAQAPPAALLEATRASTARLWDSLYAQTLRACDRYVSTNHLVDGLRVYQVLRLLWFSRKLGLAHWAGGGFDEYHTLIDLQRAQAGADQQPSDDGKATVPASLEPLGELSGQLVRIEQARGALAQLLNAGMTDGSETIPSARRFNARAIELLNRQPALAGQALQGMTVAQIGQALDQAQSVAVTERERLLAAIADPAGGARDDAVRQALAKRPPRRTSQAGLGNLVAGDGEFHVALDVGEMKPPLVGDLVLVEQSLKAYVQGELGDLETIMRGERRERTLRTLSRSTQTTSTETFQEQEESSSLKVDERYSLSAQSQQAASESFGIQAGVSVTGKFGPVQVNASVNASYDTSKSSSDTQSQEYAKTVTEEASKRVKTSIKESSSLTLLNETQDTSLRGFNNEKGSGHVNGLYRWINRVDQARLLSYGRRLMFSFNVHQPAAFYRALLAQAEAAQTAALVEPVAPWRLGRTTVEPLPEHNTTGGVRSFEDIREDNYARLAAQYDVSVEPPPPEYLTGSKAIAYPDAMQPGKISEHDHVNDLSLVAADNTLTLDPDYRLTSVAVFACEGKTDGLGSWVDALKLGEDGDKVKDANLVLVQVANQSFYLSARKDPDNGDQKLIRTNFNTWAEIEEDWHAFGEVVQPALPITISANFEGIVALTVMFKAYRLQEAFDRWRAQTFAAIVKGYNAKKQAYDQALAAAAAQARSGTQAQTSALRTDQYRRIESTELKRGCIELMSRGSALGYTSIVADEDGHPRTVFDPAEGATLPNWRSPLANGAVAEFFETAFDWANMVYQFHPYYWTGSEDWNRLAQAGSDDALFEQFLRAGNANVTVPVLPGYERPVILFYKTGLIFAGGYLSLFTAPEMLDAYADAELGRQFDPPLQIGEPWELQTPTSMLMLQEDAALPTYDLPGDEREPAPPAEPEPDETVPF